MYVCGGTAYYRRQTADGRCGDVIGGGDIGTRLGVVTQEVRTMQLAIMTDISLLPQQVTPLVIMSLCPGGQLPCLVPCQLQGPRPRKRVGYLLPR